MYDEDELEDIDSAAEFYDRMTMVFLFKDMPETFTFEEFAKRFNKMFPRRKNTHVDLIAAIGMFIGMEWIEMLDEDGEKFMFNGIDFGDYDQMS